MDTILMLTLKVLAMATYLVVYFNISNLALIKGLANINIFTFLIDEDSYLKQNGASETDPSEQI